MVRAGDGRTAQVPKSVINVESNAELRARTPQTTEIFKDLLID